MCNIEHLELTEKFYNMCITRATCWCLEKHSLTGCPPLFYLIYGVSCAVELHYSTLELMLFQNISIRCGAAEAKCAGVDIAHDGYCDIWEGTTNIGSTTALHAAQSLQLVHILWLLVAGLMIIFGNVP